MASMAFPAEAQATEYSHSINTAANVFAVHFHSTEVGHGCCCRAPRIDIAEIRQKSEVRSTDGQVKPFKTLLNSSCSISFKM